MGSLASDVIIGIDLGTTNSLVAVTRAGRAEVLRDAFGKSLVPSLIYANQDEVVVGEKVRQLRITQPENTAYSVKRYIGRGKHDLDERTLKINNTSQSTDQNILIQLGSKSYTAIELSAEILKKLKGIAESALNHPVKKAVITVPAYFNDSQRTATRKAGELAGLEVVRIVNEPTAAALAYGLDKKKIGTIAVYDLGGGTFDISILRIEDGVFEVLATGGDTLLGGDDIDRAIYEKLSQTVKSQWGPILDHDLELRAKLLNVSQQLKVKLSTVTKARLTLDKSGRTLDLTLTQEELAQLSEPLIQKTIQVVRNTLKDANVRAQDVTDVIMVGGSTRMPLVRNAVQEFFGKPLNTSLNPDEVVALGAAIQGQILGGQIQDMVLVDVVPLSLGIETYGGTVSKIILRNAKIPTVAKEAFTTHVDGQRNVLIHVVQGERELAQDCRSLARFNLQGLPPWPAGLAKIEVTFLIDANGILSVRAKELTSGQETHVDVKPTYGLTDEEVEKMLLASFEHAEGDMTERQIRESRVQAEGILKSADKIIREAKSFFSNGHSRTDISKTISDMETQIMEVRSLSEGQDYLAIKNALEKLEETAKPLTTELMNAAISRRLENVSVADALKPGKE